MIAPELDDDQKSKYTAEQSSEPIIVQHFPNMKGLDMRSARILESDVSNAFKDQELAKFKANVKRAFEHRISMF